LASRSVTTGVVAVVGQRLTLGVALPTPAACHCHAMLLLLIKHIIQQALQVLSSRFSTATMPRPTLRWLCRATPFPCVRGSSPPLPY
jgi:hypothetical protein